VHTLIELFDLFYKSSYNSHDFVRIFILNFAKAFDLVNRRVLMRDFRAYKYPSHITACSMSFLRERRQYAESTK
jgi:hypothetical protein